VKLGEILPFLRGWIYDFQAMQTPKTVPAGETRTLWSSEKQIGWVFSAQAYLTHPDAVFTIEYDGLTAPFSATAMRNGGLAQPTPVGFWLSRFDTTEKVYVIQFTPETPLGFSRACKFTLTAPRDADVNYLFNYLIVRILDEKTFRRSLLELEQGGLKL
jgi:hypothetical protein